MDIPTLTLAKSYTDSQRLAHIEVSKTVIFQEAEIAFKEISNGKSFFNTDTPFGLVVGETYEVMFNGTKYVRKAQLYEDTDNELAIVYIGNLALEDPYSESTGEPFIVEELNDMGDMIYAIGTSLPADTYSLCIERVTETIHPIDPKYIPAMDSLTLVSPDGTSYKVTVDDSGNLTATAT